VNRSTTTVGLNGEVPYPSGELTVQSDPKPLDVVNKFHTLLLYRNVHLDIMFPSEHSGIVSCYANFGAF
jgi:hypothetical protein